MGYSGLQTQRDVGGIVNVNSSVIFNKILLNSANFINYNASTGEITILKKGFYYIDWWVSTKATLSNFISF